MSEERLRLHRVGYRILEIEQVDDSGETKLSEYPVRKKLDVETMATFLEIEETLTSNRHPETGQPLTGREKASFYREAHARIIEVIHELTPTARVSFDLDETLAVMALICGNVSVAIEIANGLAGAAGVETVETQDGDAATVAAGAGGGPLSPSEPPSPSASTGSESETDGAPITGEGSPGTSSSVTSPTPAAV